ncbi:hypothetical protein GCM10010286_32210 [Streptomyces toxytricini]|nr:hypothetical protein GCM10010286_32210 [Streptomyces toxytricini]
MALRWLVRAVQRRSGRGKPWSPESVTINESTRTSIEAETVAGKRVNLAENPLRARPGCYKTRLGPA